MATCFDGCFEGIFGSPNKSGGFGGSSTPFIVITRITTNAGKRNEYLKIAKAIADANKSEPGMLHQTFDADPTDGNKFVWTQVYQNDAAFMKHLKNEATGEYLSKHGELGNNYAVEVYGTVGPDLTGALKRKGFSSVKFFSSKLGFTCVDKVDPEAKARTLFSSSTPFILIGRVTTKPGKSDEYTKLARLASKEVKESEPGMLHQSCDADPSDRTKLVWSEVYQNDAAFMKHLKNEAFGECLTQQAELATDFSLEVYGTVGDEVKSAIRKKGLPATYFKTQLGSSRV